jgi:hypothetical protein
MSRDALATLPISVVIPTLGGKALVRTLGVLNTGPMKPAEILVCFPETQSNLALKFDEKNIKLVPTPERGQVQQRAYGLACASQPYVMQLDDDVIVDYASLKVLLEQLIRLGKGNVVSPLGWRYLSTGQYMTVSKLGVSWWLQNLYLYLVCGPPWGYKRMGKLSRAGIGFWIDKAKISVDAYETELLPGGCALCHKEDLVLENYYPYDGKAYCEDLMHSIIWRERGKRLWAILNAEATTHVELGRQSYGEMVSNYRAHRYVVNLMKGSQHRLAAWFFVMVVKGYARNKFLQVVSLIRVKQVDR